MACSHSSECFLKRRRLKRFGERLQRLGSRRRHTRLFCRRFLFHRLRAHADSQRIHRPTALLQVEEKPWLDVPKAGGERVVSGEQRQDSVLDETRFHVGAQVIRQQFRQIALQGGPDGGTGNTSLNSIALDTTGAAWVAGAAGAYFPTTSGAYQAATGTGVLFITLLTVSYQSIKAALENPVKSLRTE